MKREHQQGKIANRVIAICILFALILSLGLNQTAIASKTLADQLKTDSQYGVSFDYTTNYSYSSKLSEYKEKGYTPANISEKIDIPAVKFSASQKQPQILSEYKGKNNVLLWNEDNEYIEWNINVPVEGLYSLQVTYCAYNDNSTDIIRAVSINGEIPFDKAANVLLTRRFRNDGEPKINNSGDQVRPGVEQLIEWQTITLYDNALQFSQPLQFYFKQGINTIKLQCIDEPVVLESISLCVEKNPTPYSEVAREYSSKGYKSADKEIYFEAENSVLYTNSSILRMLSDSDPLTSPNKSGNIVMNVIGATGWQNGGSAATWGFYVDEPGLYKMALRVKQNYREGLPSYRRIEIDNNVPFEEFENYKFLFSQSWRTEVLSNEEGQPYEVFLDKGNHTIKMSVAQGELSAVQDIITADSLKLSKILLKIRMITGQTPDYNYDYELDKNIPDLMDDLKSLQNNMKLMMNIIEKASESKPSMYYQLEGMIKQLEKLIEDPYYIPRRLNDINSTLTTYGQWIISFQQHPLMIDYFKIVPIDYKVENKQSSFLQRTKVSIINFLLSFVKDYDNITSAADSDIKTDIVLDVWIGRGKDWGTLLKQMADESFTPKTGIGVNLNILPAGQLNAGSVNAMLLAIASGTAPDVGLGTPTNSIGEFAIRNALYDIEKYSDFKQISSRFYEEMFLPMTYNGGVFGLPETMNFKLIVYRKDILSELGMSIPNTWDELYNHLIPVLYQNNMQFYLPGGEAGYDMFLYQLGGDYYNKNADASALDTPQAYQAFKEFCEMYTLYGVPITASFFNRFRTGEMPIGIADYVAYMQIVSAAPELKGRIGIAVLPGHLQDDGTINRTHTSITGESAMIMQQSEHPDEAWEFLKWWTDQEVQQEFGNEIESTMGQAARWNTANIEAFYNLPWLRNDAEIIKKSYEQIAQLPVVFGGYFTSRHINNAFNRTVVSKQDPRDSLEQAVKDINRELRRRRESMDK